MNAIDAVIRILNLGLDNTVCGTIVLDSNVLEECQKQFGSYRAILSPQPYTTYLYEWRKADSPNEIGEPDALLIQPTFDDTMLIYMYELTNDWVR